MARLRVGSRVKHRWLNVAILLALAVLISLNLPIPTSAVYSPRQTATGAGALWTVAQLRQATRVEAPYSEPGMGLVGSGLLGPADLASPANPSGTLEVLITLAFSNASQLQSLLEELQDPASPEYHRYLTAPAFDAEFGGDPAVYRSIIDYLDSFGVESMVTHPDRLTVSFQATPYQVDSIFDTKIGFFQDAKGRPYYAPETPPKIPAPLAQYTVDVMGLSDYSQYQLSFAPLESISVPPVNHTVNRLVSQAGPAPVDVSPRVGTPGSSDNPFASTSVTSNSLTLTYDQPLLLNVKGTTDSCDAIVCGELMQGADLQVAYNETGVFQRLGYPSNASVAAVLWTDPICTSSSSSCGLDGFYNYHCSQYWSSGDYAWDFFEPDVTSFWNYSIPSGEPMPTAISLPLVGPTYASGYQGYSASCDNAGAEGENTLDVAMLGSMAPGANVFQVWGEDTLTYLGNAWADILSPSTGEFSNAGGTDIASNIAKLGNVSVITNSWGISGSLTSTFTSALQDAAARGITILGASGDSGTTINPPAESAYNTYGTLAVGGTTTVLNQTLLTRTPAHVASMSAPYYGVGGGEIGWYEPAGSVDGFSSTYGSAGGVATSTSYYRASWFNASSDAVSIANAVRSGNYRAEPDVAAIANDTIFDFEEGPYSLNFTCWVSSACKAISPIATGETSGSAPTVSATYVIGTSIATPVTGGVLATIDHALYVDHENWVGFNSPSLYSMGQLQYTGDLTLHTFYDVTVYTGAGGSTASYEAKPGYDLATGWGVIDAGNYTQNVLTFPVTFTELGLPQGASWAVSLTPSVGDATCVLSSGTCANIITVHSTGATVSFTEPFGTYSYSILPPSGDSASNSSGSIFVSGSGVTVQETFLLKLAALTALLEVYANRSDLRTDFPNADSSFTRLAQLVDWAQGVVSNSSGHPDPAQTTLLPYGYYYDLLAVYNERADLQSAFPDAYASLNSYLSLLAWSKGVVSDQWADPAYGTLLPYSYYYALMGLYGSRTDLQSAYPDAIQSQLNFTELVNWADGVVEGEWSDSGNATLQPFAYYYVLMAVYDSRSDLQAAFPSAYTNQTSFMGLLAWSMGVGARDWSDPAYSTLEPWGFYYALLGLYSSRSDLRTAFPDAFGQFASYVSLIDWAKGVVEGLWADSGEAVLAPFGYYYVLMGIYESRTDLQLAYPDAFTSWSAYTGLLSWAGGVVEQLWTDPAYAQLLPYASYYIAHG